MHNYITVNNIQYDLDGTYGFEKQRGSNLTSKDGTRLSMDESREEVLAELPTTFRVKLPSRFIREDKNVLTQQKRRSEREDYIQEHLEDKLGWLVVGFEYEWMGLTFKFQNIPHYVVVSSLESGYYWKINSPN